jgi:transposase
MKMYIGLDVHCKSTVYVCQNENGEEVGRGKVPTQDFGLRKMLVDLNAPEGTRIGLESGTQMYLVTRILMDADMEPVVIDAAEVHAKIHRSGQKSDYRDAFAICEGVRNDIYSSIVYIPDEKVLRLRHILSRRRHFVGVRTAQINAVRFLLRTTGQADLARSLGTESAWQKLLDYEQVADLRPHLLLHCKMWILADKTIAYLDKELNKAQVSFKREMELLQSVPGVGPITAASFIAAVGDISRFAHARHMASYLGLVPSTYDSSQTQRHGHITRNGPSHVRAVLCEAAHHASRATNPFNPWWRQICGRSGYLKAMVAVAHRLIRVMYAIWRDGRPFSTELLGVVQCDELVRQKKVYRLRRSA